MIDIDGSSGEGGGQVLRSALALSLLTGKALHLRNIRAKRSKPGLMAQHLVCVEASAKISQAEVEGAKLGSTSLVFQPGEVRSGRYRFDIPTAGSTSLVLQTIFLPLAMVEGTSQVTISGGTHVPYAPVYHYLELQWLPHLEKIGFQVRLALEQAGFYPAGGGCIHATIRNAGKFNPLKITDRGKLLRIQGLSGVANLDIDIARRQKLQALRRLEPIHRETKIQTLRLPSPVKGTFLLLLTEFENAQCCYTSLGAPGKRAEIVADEAVDALLSFLEADGAVDPYLADQLLLPLALAQGKSVLRTSCVTQHLVTNAEIIQRFLPVKINIEGETGQPGLVKLTGHTINK